MKNSKVRITFDLKYHVQNYVFLIQNILHNSFCHAFIFFRFASFIFSCSLTSEGMEQPIGVRLSYGKGKTTDLIPIYKTRGNFRNFTVCVPCMYDYDQHHQLVDFIETNYYFGANHFVIYNKSHSNKVGQFLTYYIAQGTITVIPWHLPNEVKDIHYYGQSAAIMDCLYRNAKTSKYIVFIDLDEKIVPRKALTWNKMLEIDANRHDQKPGAYIFMCKFFQVCKNFTVIDELAPYVKRRAAKYNITGLLVRTALKKMFKHRIRSKVIINSQAVHLLKIHSVFKFFPNYTNILVDPSVGLLHHYRTFNNSVSDVELDPYMDQFGNILSLRIQNVHRHVKSETMMNFGNVTNSLK